MARDGGASGASAEALLTGLNRQQREAVLTTSGPLLILAGAGSGKTRVITHRIAYLIRHQGVAPWRILAITFTNKAASEMKRRAEALIGEASGLWIGTFHTMMLRILRRYGEAVGARPGFSIVNTDESTQIIKRVLKAKGFDSASVAPRSLLHEISKAKTNGVGPLRYEASAKGDAYRTLVAAVYSGYCEALDALNGVDFDDILGKTLTLFDRCPDTLAHYQEQFLHVMVDEYQDTNHVQYELIKRLSAGHHNLAVVGDDDQSIYRFRGADLSNILDFEHDHPDATVIRLEQNYRSTKTILHAANAVIQNNECRKDKTLWTEGPTGDPLVIYHADSPEDEARYVVSSIARRRQATPRATQAILYRASALTRVIEAALRHHNLSYAIYGGMCFYDRKEIRDAIAYMRLAVNPNDSLAAQRVVNEPRRGVGETTIERIESLMAQSGASFVAVARRAGDIPELSRVAAHLQAFVDVVDRLSASLDDGHGSFASWVEETLSLSGMASALADAALRDVTAAARLENLGELISDAAQFDEAQRAAFDRDEPLTRRALAEAYVEQATLYSDQDRETTRPDVLLMTIHSAKGLEFDDVYVVGMEEGLFPSSQSLGEPQGLEEERRLAYVAMTRAKRHLTLTLASSRLLYGRTTYNAPSRFLNDIPDEWVVVHGGVCESWMTNPKRTTSSLQSVTSARSSASTKRDPLFETLTRLTHVRRQVAASSALDPDTLAIGDALTHAKHGRGTLTALTRTGSGAILRIAFADGERRYMNTCPDLTRSDT